MKRPDTAIKKISPLKGLIVPAEAVTNQKQIKTTRTRANVTTCLYLSPNNSARSLSTLIAADVKSDTPLKIQVKMLYDSWTKLKTFPFTSVMISRMKVAKSGCATSPTQKSVTVKHRKKSFVGGQIGVTLWRAARIRAFPRHAVMDRKMFKAKNKSSIPNDGLGGLSSLLVKFFFSSDIRHCSCVIKRLKSL